ncbi:MAG TPA: response regulator [Nitrospiraceae bacterium]|nr:response regulator [Nitrospiraceae bacterium]
MTNGPVPPIPVLIIDDDQVFLQVLPEMLSLRMPDVCVTTCTSVSLALEKIQQTQYHAIVCDIKMPGMSGFDFLAQVRHSSPWTPILLISGHAGEHIAKQALEEGAYDFIQKPLDRDAFILAMKRALEAHDLRTGGPNHLVKGSMLCVLGLDPKINVDDIKKLFLPYGKIAWARLIVNSNGHEIAIGYVEMSSKEDAVGAVHALDGYRVFDRPIRVGFSTAPFAKWAV